MQDAWTNRWDERYSSKEFAYGEAPNNYLEQELKKFPTGHILFPAEGEGRNAAFAAKLGWQVTAFDISTEGRNKALQLAEANQVTIDYQIANIETLPYSEDQFDVIALIYSHFPANIKSQYHVALDKFLRKGGTIIFEAFSKKHVDYITNNPAVGGPKDIDSLFSIEEIKADFNHYHFEELEETVIDLNEGIYHNGRGSVIRFVATKQ